MKATLILPNHLFEKHPALEKGRDVWLVEEFLFFRVQNFHKQRLILLRAAMKNYEEFLKKKGYKVHYLQSQKLKKRGDLFSYLKEAGVEEIYMAEETDDWFCQDVEKAARSHKLKIRVFPSPMFLSTLDEIETYFKKQKHLSMAPFYAHQRKTGDFLMKNGKPIGGKFSFDHENRKRIPSKIKIPKIPAVRQDKAVEEAIEYVKKEFPKAIGEGTSLLYPPTFLGAKKILSDFLENKFVFFGDYEDAIVKDESFLFHSVLSPLLNIGLLTPRQIIDEALQLQEKVPLNSMEGFIRQIIGWREFVRASYHLKGAVQRTGNFFHHKKSLPKGFWDGTTGIEPIDATIQKILKTGYCHHIERLMVLGNFLLLVETEPDEVYRWFMEYFVDAYDWVMVPNVYGMSQYADGGLITTKPYISSSNYLLKMGDYKKGPWTEIWDGLFWRFLKKHKPFFSKNPRMKVLLGYLQKNNSDIGKKISLAEAWEKKQRSN
ncbi:MAG: cryptochrome/photolyase family protein [Verrucomicrobia bacterium]|nr:cryptochrome/photolyase family protein [Verrucomicrobiota bacterium]